MLENTRCCEKIAILLIENNIINDSIYAKRWLKCKCIYTYMYGEKTTIACFRVHVMSLGFSFIFRFFFIQIFASERLNPISAYRSFHPYLVPSIYAVAGVFVVEKIYAERMYCRCICKHIF